MAELVFMGLDWHAWLTIVLTLSMFVTLLKTKLPVDVVFISVVALLVVTGCLPTEDALSGFSSDAFVMVGALFVVVAGLEATGVLQWIVKHLLGEPSAYWKAILRMMLPVAFLSALMSNTTVVALFIKVVKIWAAKLKISPSKLLIPLSYAAGMGGICTLIGTPTNLIISSFYAEKTGEKLGIFAPALPGAFCLIVGVATIILLQRLLPERKAPEDELAEGSQGSTIELKVPADSHLPGQTLADIRLLDECSDCRLLGIIRYDGEVETILEGADGEGNFMMGGDTLVFSGNRNTVLQIGRNHGMECDMLDRTIEPQQGGRSLLSSCIMLGMVVLSAFNIVPLLNSCFIAALLMLFTRCCSVSQAKKAIDWDVLVVFASSIALGKAIENTGLAQILADNVTSICGTNALVALVIIATLGTFLTEIVSNTACGAIMAPIAIKIAVAMGANPMTFCMALMIAVSSSFATPIGSPTHLMVYVPGGYRFSDFMRIGLPMNFIILAANIMITLILFPLYI